MQFRRSNDVRVADSDWHKARQRARETAFNSSLNIFSEEEKVKYDLETARIDGSDNPQTYTVNRPIDLLGTNGLDLRTLFNR